MLRSLALSLVSLLVLPNVPAVILNTTRHRQLTHRTHSLTLAALPAMLDAGLTESAANAGWPSLAANRTIC